MNQNKDWDWFVGKVFTQLIALGLALTGYRGLMRFLLGFESFWFMDVVVLAAGVSLFFLFELC